MIRRVENESMSVELVEETLVIEAPDGAIILTIDEANDLREMLDVMFQYNQLYRLTARYKDDVTPVGLTHSGNITV